MRRQDEIQADLTKMEDRLQWLYNLHASHDQRYRAIWLVAASEYRPLTPVEKAERATLYESNERICDVVEGIRRNIRALQAELGRVHDEARRAQIEKGKAANDRWRRQEADFRRALTKYLPRRQKARRISAAERREAEVKALDAMVAARLPAEETPDETPSRSLDVIREVDRIPDSCDHTLATTVAVRAESTVSANYYCLGSRRKFPSRRYEGFNRREAAASVWR